MQVPLSDEQKIKINDSREIYEIMRRILEFEQEVDQNCEHLRTMGLNIKHRIKFIFK